MEGGIDSTKIKMADATQGRIRFCALILDFDEK